MQVLKLDQQLSDLEATEREKQTQLDARKAILADRIRQAYDTDRTSLLETFLSGETFTDVLADVSYHLDFAEQDRQLAEQIVADQKVLTVLHLTVESTRTQTADLRAAADTQRVKLQADLAALADAQTRLAKLEAETRRLLAAQQAAYRQMARDKVKLAATIEASEKAEAALQKQIDALVAAQYQGGSIPSRYNGTLAWPMRGTITQEFGCTGFAWEPRKGSCAHWHNGIDIAAPIYTPIRAAGPGTVLFAGPNPYDSAPKAWIVIIAHSSNLLTWYAHIDNYTHPPAVRAGQHVVKGQIIAYEGMTGHTTGPHLHWMVELNSTFVNPRPVLGPVEPHFRRDRARHAAGIDGFAYPASTLASEMVRLAPHGLGVPRAARVVDGLGASFTGRSCADEVPDRVRCYDRAEADPYPDRGTCP